MRSYARAALCKLIGDRLGAGGRLHNIAAGLLAGAYVRTAFCGVDRAGRNERAVDIHKGVHQISIGARISFRGRISHRFELRVGIDIILVRPLVAVVDIRLLARSDRQLRRLVHIHLHAGQKRNVLFGGDAAARRDVQGHIVRDRQHKTRRIYRHPKIELQAVELRLPVHRIDHTVLGRVVLLGQAAGDHIEHAAAADKVYIGGILVFICIDIRMENFLRARINGQRRLDILDIILGKWENSLIAMGAPSNRHRR